MVTQCWQFGVRPQADYANEFRPEFHAMLNLPHGAPPDGSTPAGAADRAAIRAEVVALMAAAHQGSVRRLAYQKVRENERLVELKCPRPGSVKGWHFRLYTGAPARSHQTYLVWSGAGRKVDKDYDPGWKAPQTQAIEDAHDRLNRWLAARLADSI